MNLFLRCISGVSLILITMLLSGCAGSTARVQQSDISVEQRRVAITPGALANINVNSDVGTFDSRDEKRNFSASLRSVVQRANLFGSDQTSPYSLDIQILDFDIPKASFSGFDSTLDVKYELRDVDGQIVFSEEISSGGSDDTGSSLGPVRQNRSRTVAVANNIELFLQRLGGTLEQLTRQAPGPIKSTVASTNFQNPGTGTRADLAPVELTSLARDDEFNFGKYYALIIGNNEYEHVMPLTSAIGDAERLDEILRKQYGFETKVLRNATRDNIVSALTEYRHSLGASDNLLIYYAGHGWVDDQADEGYWLPVDAASEDPSRWLSNATLTTTIRAMQAHHILVIADSCFSGKLTRGINVGVRSNDFMRRLVAKKARTALTSGGLEPVLDGGGKGNHSIFASALFDALEQNTGVVDTSQMFNVIRRQVALNADQFPEYGDIRRAGHDGGDFLFVRKQ